MRADDVLSVSARARYGLDMFRVPLEQATAPAMTDAGFADPSLALDLYEPFLFDALYTFLIAINQLLNGGYKVEEIKGETLLKQLRLTEFEGISGFVSFDENGDRQASYELVNLHPEGMKVAGLYRSDNGVFAVAAGNVYWIGGVQADSAPSFLTDCRSGSYKDELLEQCVACKKGFQCVTGMLPELCPKGTFSNTTGTAVCKKCGKGSFYGDLGSTRCINCPAGFFADKEGMEQCLRCPRPEGMEFCSHSHSCNHQFVACSHE